MPEDNEPVLAILIPEDGGLPIVHVGIDRIDGGLAAVEEHLGGESDELPWPAHRSDVVALIREDGMRSDLPRNNRATRLLERSLAVGYWIGGDCLVCGQLDDGGLGPLPADVTAELLTMATQDVNA